MELIHRSEIVEDKLLSDLAAIAAPPHVKYVILTPDVTVASVHLHSENPIKELAKRISRTD